ncbi:vWA domain-containing protein [Thalassococcus sp. BH17M4-6]|uniref:vWA domain-containing protein n=1 Tax=Thalassococcus sp. BH17M4-6 TaxID=3413148 RepID=UPI003BCDBB51
MTDELDKLRAAMQAATPEPDRDAKARHLALAQKNFDALQGSRSEVRHTPESTPKGGGLMTGVIRMFAEMTSRKALVGTTSLVAASVALFVVLPVGEFSRAPTPVVATEVEESPRLRQPADPLAMADAPSPGAVTGGIMAESMPSPAPRVQMKTAPQGDAATSYLAPPSPSRASPELMVMAEADTEAFANADPNPLKVTAEDPVSTFSIDVDTASYGIVRSSILRGQLPPPDAVRIEEMINYFPYDYAAPEPGDAPFRPAVSVVQAPWNDGTRLVHIGLQGEMPAVADRPPLNLVFLIDTSGSMQDSDKLPLLVQSFRLMLAELRAEDEVAIVTYAGSAGLALEPTPAAERGKIMAALSGLQAGGSTAGQAGLQQAYAVAEEMQGEGELSRVLLATDGDFNVGLSDPGALEDFIADKREGGTYLSVLGFGRGNLDDATMQALAQNGNGRAAYIDTLSEARKVLVDELSGALFPIADDVKIQVEFNPAAVAEYRLIGYETRALAREDFANDAVDAGEIGAGHSVTALYEVTPVGSDAVLNAPLRYGEAAATGDAQELGFLRLRYKAPGDATSQLIETPIANTVAAADADVRFATAIAGFGQLLRDGKYLGDWGLDDATALAVSARGEDAFGYRTEAIELMRLAAALQAARQ